MRKFFQKTARRVRDAPLMQKTMWTLAGGLAPAAWIPAPYVTGDTETAVEGLVQSLATTAGVAAGYGAGAVAGFARNRFTRTPPPPTSLTNPEAQQRVDEAFEGAQETSDYERAQHALGGFQRGSGRSQDRSRSGKTAVALRTVAAAVASAASFAVTKNPAFAAAAASGGVAVTYGAEAGYNRGREAGVAVRRRLASRRR